jgi:hypothetical protein
VVGIWRSLIFRAFRLSSNVLGTVSEQVSLMSPYKLAKRFDVYDMLFENGHFLEFLVALEIFPFLPGKQCPWRERVSFEKVYGHMNQVCSSKWHLASVRDV